MRRIIAIAAAAVAALPLCGVVDAQNRTTDPERYARCEAGLHEIIVRAGIPSISLVYVSPEDSMSFSVVNEEFYAREGVTKEVLPISDKSIYQACSISKLPLAYIAVRMMDNGELELEKPLWEYYPGLLDMFATDQDKEYAKLLNARICLTHRTGLDNKTYSAMTFGFIPDEKFKYSGPGMYALQCTIEHIKGSTLDKIADEMVFTPLGMHNTSYLWNDSYESMHLYGHGTDLKTSRNNNWAGGKCNAAYSMRTNAAELTAFIRCVMHGWGLSGEAFAMMTKPYGKSLPASYKERERQSMFRCLGWVLEKNSEFGPVYLHTGNNVRFKGLALYMPEKDASLVYLVNGQYSCNINDAILPLFFDNSEPFSFVAKAKPLPEK